VRGAPGGRPGRGWVVPLKKGYSKSSIGKNVAKMRREGKPAKQAVAAALDTARAAAKRAGKPAKAPPKK
jgi:hypothetical protein